jgi:ankyrin repeat protein
MCMNKTGAELNGQNRHGLTPLHEAALRGNVAVVQVKCRYFFLVVISE